MADDDEMLVGNIWSSAVPDQGSVCRNADGGSPGASRWEVKLGYVIGGDRLSDEVRGISDAEATRTDFIASSMPVLVLVCVDGVEGSSDNTKSALRASLQTP